MEDGEFDMLQFQRKMFGELHNWDRNVLGELEKRISKVKRELEWCRRVKGESEKCEAGTGAEV